MLCHVPHTQASGSEADRIADLEAQVEQLEREVERAGSSSRGGAGTTAAAGAGAGLVGDAAAVAALAKYNKLKERYKVRRPGSTYSGSSGPGF